MNKLLRRLKEIRKTTRRAPRGSNVPARRVLIEHLEDRLMLDSRSLLYQAADARPLLLQLSGDRAEIVNADSPSEIIVSRPLRDISSGVRIDGAGYDVRLTIDRSVPQIPGGI